LTRNGALIDIVSRIFVPSVADRINPPYSNGIEPGFDHPLCPPPDRCCGLIFFAGVTSVIPVASLEAAVAVVAAVAEVVAVAVAVAESVAPAEALVVAVAVAIAVAVAVAVAAAVVEASAAVATVPLCVFRGEPVFIPILALLGLALCFRDLFATRIPAFVRL
jgi:hypothetical protein